ncbi:MAG TPA: hypothetical protein VNV85_06110 [Puia sp.]|jgi:hypothetical protein|nr:hypothetical protein [Puia sp.]
MKRNAQLFFLWTLIYALLCSCQKEYSYEGNFISSGSLVKDANNNCSAVTVTGLYNAGKKLNDSNFIVVQVHVDRSGNYNIRTDTLNGFSFSGSGSFADTGYVRVKLAGIGNPTTPGAELFTVNYGSSMCTISVQVAEGLLIAAYTLRGSPNGCMNDTVIGSYIKGIPLDTSEKILVALNVISPGSYFISTDTVNGYSFSGSGILSATGIQTVMLTANGTPINAGIDVFKALAGASTCSFSNTVYTPVVTITNPDHFPLTVNSYWNYDDLFNTGDTIGRVIIDTISESGNRYEIMKENLSAGSSKQYYYRKQGNDYYEYAAVDKYTNSVQYAPTIYGDINFLKENLKTGDSWYSTEFSDTATFGQVILLQYYFICKNASAAVVVNGKAFTNVYIILMQPQIAALNYTPGPTGEKYTYYYAKGVGLIYCDVANLFYTRPQMQIRNWVVY